MTDEQEVEHLDRLLRRWFGDRHYVLMYQSASGQKTGWVADAASSPEVVKHVAGLIIQMADDMEKFKVVQGNGD